MTDDRYPADLTVTRTDFEQSGWKAALGTANREGYDGMWTALSNAAKSSLKDGKTAEGKALWLLADACSMMLAPESYNEPFKPSVVIGGRRSAMPEDFTKADLEFFTGIIELIDDPWLQARVSDIVWLQSKPRNVESALTAIDAYRSLPLDTDMWIRGSGDCWKRAFQLALLLRDTASDRLSEMEAVVLSAFLDTTLDDGFLGVWLSDLLSKHGLAQAHRPQIAEYLQQLGMEFDAQSDFHKSREYFEKSASWFRRAGDATKSAEMTAACAEGWVREAELRITSKSPSHMVAARFYENAIQIYRDIPRSERNALNVDGRIKELRDLLTESGQRSLDEMVSITSQGTDITKLVKDARESVRGKELVEALIAFTNLYQIDVDSIRDSARDQIRSNPLSNLFPATMMSRDGRVIAKHEGAPLGGGKEDEDALRAAMLRCHGLLMSLVVQGSIMPALEVLIQEHRIRVEDFIGLAKESPIVPKDRAGLFGKALFAGFDFDFETALHLLVPQLENMVRFHLKQAGIKTTTLDRNGIETENGMTTLMEITETKTVFGAELAFELRALFCDSLGPNLRNEVSHGLLADGQGQSATAIYAWWFGLKLVFMTYWNALRRNSPIDNDNDAKAGT